MQLAFPFLLTLLVELPVIAFFFRKRKRSFALMAGFFINLITWIIYNVVRLNTDWDLTIAFILLAILEFIFFWFAFGRNLKKAFLIAIIANTLSFVATKYIKVSNDLFQKKTNIIK